MDDKWSHKPLQTKVRNFGNVLNLRQPGKYVILSSAMASKYPLKFLLPLVILKDSSMTLEVDTREKELDTGSHSLQHRDTLQYKQGLR